MPTPVEGNHQAASPELESTGGGVAAPEDTCARIGDAR